MVINYCINMTYHKTLSKSKKNIIKQNELGWFYWKNKDYVTGVPPLWTVKNTSVTPKLGGLSSS